MDEKLKEIARLRKKLTKLQKVEDALYESEQKARALLNSPTDSLALIGRDGTIFEINEQMASRFGRKIDELIGKHIWDLMPPHIRTVRQANTEKVFKTGDFVRFEEHGVTGWFDSCIFPVFDKSGKVIRVGVMAREIIERKNMELALQESEEKYRNLVENSLEGIGISKGNKVVYANKALLDIFGYGTLDEFIKIPLLDHVAPESKAKISDRLKKREKGDNAPIQFEYKIIRKDGEIRDLEIATSEVLIRGEKHVQSTFRDITERKRAEEEIKEKLMRFKLEKGRLYMVKENAPGLSVEAFKDLMRVGYKGLVISRTPSEKLEKTIEGSFDFLLLTEKKSDISLSSDLNEVIDKIRGLPKKTAVLFDRLDYLVYKNGFEKTLLFVERLRDELLLSEKIIILSIDPETFKGRWLRLLEKEALQVRSWKSTRLPEGQQELLGFVYRQNKIGVQPSFSEIRKELGISKPTIGKWIHSLTSSEYVRVAKKGRKKILSITEKGSNFFSL